MSSSKKAHKVQSAAGPAKIKVPVDAAKVSQPAAVKAPTEQQEQEVNVTTYSTGHGDESLHANVLPSTMNFVDALLTIFSSLLACTAQPGNSC